MQPTVSFKAETSIGNDIPTTNAPTFIRPRKRLKTRYNKESNEPIVSVEFGTALNSAHSSNFIDSSMRTFSGNSNSSIFSLHNHTNKLTIYSRNNSFEEAALSRQSSIGSDEFLPTAQDPEEIVQEDVSTLHELRKEEFSKGSLKKAIRKGQEIPITTSPEVWTSAVEDLMKKGIKLPETVPVYTEEVVTNLRS